MEKKETRTIDVTPSWGAVGNIYRHLAASNEQAAMAAMDSEVARAFAAAEALQAIQSKLPDDLNEMACSIVDRELALQGYGRNHIEGKE